MSSSLIYNRQLVDRVMASVRGVIQFTGEIDLYADLTDFGMDSMKTMEVVVALENEFGIQFEDEDLLLTNFSTVERMVEQVDKRLTGGAQSGEAL